MAEMPDGKRSSKTDEMWMRCLLFCGLQEVSHDVHHVIPIIYNRNNNATKGCVLVI